MKQRGLLIVISAPSGAGKTTVCRDFLKKNPQVRYAISTTTRQPREGEKDGVDYFFVSEEKFDRLIKEKAFLEYARVFNNYYGTSKQHVNELIEQGYDVMIDIDTQGAATIRSLVSNAVQIFILPPSLNVLKQRLRDRGKDSNDIIKLRLSHAKDEISESKKYHYVIINDEIDQASKKLASIIEGEKLKVSRNLESIEELLKG